MPGLLSGKVAIVTGAGGGIGGAIVARLALAGADLSLVDRDFSYTAQWGGPASASEVVDLVKAAGQRAIVAEGDASERDFAQSVVNQAMSAFGAIDILVNCAGGAFTPIPESFASTSSDAEFEVLFRANYRSTVVFSQTVIPCMRRTQSGTIVNITSGYGNITPRDGSRSHYLASKAAVTSFTTSLANEVGEYGIRVNAISPGLILSPRVKVQAFASSNAEREQLDRICMRRFGQPDEIAKVVEFFASDLASYVTGQVLPVTGG